MKGADGADELGLFQQTLEGFEQFVGEGFAVVGQESCHGLAFQVLPEPFDGIEVRTVGGQVDGLDMMPVKTGALVRARVVEHEMDLLAFLARNLFGQGVEKGLEDSVLQWATTRLTGCPLAGSTAPTTLRVGCPPWYPWVGQLPRLTHRFRGRGSPSKPASSPKKTRAAGSASRAASPAAQVALFQPSVPVGRLWHWSRDAAGVVLLVEVVDERAAGDVEGFFPAQPAAELDGGPVELTGQRGIVDDGQDLQQELEPGCGNTAFRQITRREHFRGEVAGATCGGSGENTFFNCPFRQFRGNHGRSSAG